jgi:hypothetical protein
MLVGEVSSLGLPIHNLGGRNGEGLISQVLNGGGDRQTDTIEEDIHPLIMMKIKRSGLIFNLFQDRIGEMKSHRNPIGKPVDRRGRKKDFLLFIAGKVCHPKEGPSPLLAEGFDL